ncbi:MAG: hypothetical protein IJS25_05615, partial [Bacteroidales bacterium]|nr:hypothetical protein [Bacteroidales bacterium]
SYWYPRMGTAYTTRNYKWQRQWFSHFDIHVVPRPRLFPVTQGMLTDTSDGYRYVSDVPVPSLTLAIGPYERITGETPSCNYHVVYQKGHDYFRPLFDGKGEEILQQVDHLRGDLERNTKISYQAFQYTLVEVPASYAPPQRWWALNGHIQPQLCLIPEKAFSMNGADMYSAYLKEVSETGSGDGMMGFMMFAGFLFIGEDYGAINQLGMFNYDVSAPWLPGCNAFFANRSNLSTLSEPPQGANAVLADHSLAELVENQTASGKLIKYKIRELCLRGCMEVGAETFWDCLKDVLRQHPYASLRLEQVFDMLADTIGINLNDYIDTWYHDKGVPYYQIEPAVLAVKKNGRDTYYEVSQIVTNESAYAGIVVAVSDVASKIVEVPPFSSRRFVLVSAQKPFRYDLMTGISLNLPSSISYRAMVQRSNLWSAMPGEAGQTRVEEVPRPLSNARADEIIVDNEDAGFSFGFASRVWGRWYAKSAYPKNEYHSGSLSDIPVLWRSILRADAFGGRIRSACWVRSTSQGAPAQESVWKIPVPRAGRYAVSHHFIIPNGEFGNTSWGFPNFVLEQIQAEDPDQVEKEIRKLDLLHHFRLRQSSGLDKKIDFQSFTYNESPGRSEQRRKFVGGWQTLDTLDLRQDTLYCTLSNRTDLKLVIADAVRLTPVKE